MRQLSGLSLDLFATTLFLGGAAVILIFALFSYMGLFSLRPNKRSQFFEGKHVLITGGSSGIGKELARLLVTTGATVTIVARNKERLEKAATELAPPGESDAAIKRVNTVSADCSDPFAVKTMVAHVENTFGPIDVLINSAGAAIGGYFEELDPATFRVQMESNYFAQLYPTHEVFKRMCERRSGHIVFVASVAGQLGVFGQSAYSPTKFAIRGLAETLYFEAKPYGIDITCVFPPDTDTPGLKKEKETMPPETQEISEDGGLFKPSDVAEFITDGICRKQFRVCCGAIGKLLGVLTAGFTPGLSLVEIFIMPIARAITPFFIADQNKIIRKGHLVRFPENK